MNKYFLIQNENIYKIFIVMFFLWFLSYFLLLFIFTFIVAIYFWLFRKKRNDLDEKKMLDANTVVSPTNGTLESIETSSDVKRLTIKMGRFRNYCLYMPVNGEVSNFQTDDKLNQRSLAIKTIGKKSVVMNFFARIPKTSGKVLLRTGDRGSLGATVGYLPFGGKVVIEIPSDSEILVKKSDKVKAYSTFLATFKDDDE